MIDTTQTSKHGDEAPDFAQRLKLAGQMIGPAKRIVMLISSPISAEAEQQLAVQMVRLMDALLEMRDSGLPDVAGPIVCVDGRSVHAYERFNDGWYDLLLAWISIQEYRLAHFEWQEWEPEIALLKAGTKGLIDFGELALRHDYDRSASTARHSLQLRIDREVTGIRSDTVGGREMPLVASRSDSDEEVKLRKADFTTLLANCHGHPPHESAISKWAAKPTFPKPAEKRGRSNLYYKHEVLAWARANTSYWHVADRYPKEPSEQ